MRIWERAQGTQVQMKAWENFGSDCIEIFIHTRTVPDDGPAQYNEGRLTFEHRDTEASVGEPTLQVTREEAVTLMDALWRSGIRPHDARDISDLVAAKDKHLKDMRTITFNRLGIEKP